MSLNGTALAIEGGPELERALAGLANEVSDKLARAAARKGTVVIRDAIKGNVPIGPGKHGHHGRDQIRMSQPKKATKGSFTERGYFEFQVTRGDAFWLDFREHGTAHQGAQPMFRSGFDSSVDRARDVVGEVLKAGILRLAKG